MSFDWGAGTTYYVAKWGNDSNAGTSPVTPKLTIDTTTTAIAVAVVMISIRERSSRGGGGRRRL